MNDLFDFDLTDAGIAAEQTGRRCYAMELSPQYVDVAVRRWQNYTGQVAVHAITGKPFPV
jgi:DNA modification methylase